MPGKLEMRKHFLKESDIPGAAAFLPQEKVQGNHGKGSEEMR